MTTPLFEAAVQGAGRTWQLLLDHPAIDVNRANTEGQSPLHWMARECSRQAMAVAETPSPTRLDMLARLLRDPRVNLRAHTASDGLNVLHMISCVFQDGRMNAKSSVLLRIIAVARCARVERVTRLFLASRCKIKASDFGASVDESLLPADLESEESKTDPVVPLLLRRAVGEG